MRQSIILKTLFGIICLVIIFTVFKRSTYALHPDPGQDAFDGAHQVRNVFLLNFNPVLEKRGSRLLTDEKGWYDPIQITDDIVQTISTVSSGYLTYRIVDYEYVDGIFPKPDGYQYTDQTYLDCIEGNGPCHSPDIISYQELFDTYNICSKDVDEVWMWGGPYFGYWEYNPVNFCGGTQFVMGFNYERSPAEAMHNFGHRMEYVGINRVGDGTWSQDESNEWNKFSLINGHCGNIHYPPGTLTEYQYDNTEIVRSDCRQYLNYPEDLPPDKITCDEWGCTQLGYVSWWLSHIPSNPGVVFLDGKYIYKNWWKYYVNYDPISTNNSFTGDANSDGVVDGLDYIIWLNYYDKDILIYPQPYYQYGDFNEDQSADGLDYIVWLNNYQL